MVLANPENIQSYTVYGVYIRFRPTLHMHPTVPGSYQNL